MLVLRDGKFVDTSRTTISQSGRLGFPSPKVGLGPQYQPFAEPEKSQFQWFSADPFLWLLDKINRPQQALFEAIHSAQEGKSFLGGLGRGFWSGSDVRATDILDEIGWRGKAGQLDWMDLVAGTLEVGLDPVNLLAFGGLPGKLGKIQKAGRVAKALGISEDALMTAGKSATEAQALMSKFQELEKVGKMPQRSIDLLENMLGKMGGTPNEDMFAKLIQRADELLVPDPGTTYMRYGIGKHVAAIPGSNVALEKSGLLPGFRAIRRSSLGQLFSTAAETPGQALGKAAKQLAEDARYGAKKEATRLWNYVTKGAIKADQFEVGSAAWEGIEDVVAKSRLTEHTLSFDEAAREYLWGALEMKPVDGRKALQGAPVEFEELHEVNHFLRELMPVLDGKAKLKMGPFVEPDVIDYMEVGIGKDMAERYAPRILDSEMLKYKQTYDEFLGKQIYGAAYTGGWMKTAGFYQKSRNISDAARAVNEWVREKGTLIFTPSKSGELGAYMRETGGVGRGVVYHSIVDKDYLESTLKINLGDVFNEKAAKAKRVLGKGDINPITERIINQGVKDGHITPAQAQEMISEIATSPKAPAAVVPGAFGTAKTPKIGIESKITASFDEQPDLFKQMMRDSFPDVTEPELNAAYGRLMRDARKAVDAGQAGTASEYINNWLIDKVELRGVNKVVNDMRRFNRLSKNVGTIMEHLKTPKGWQIGDARFRGLFENAYHRKTFKQFYTSDWAQSWGKRLGEDYVNRSASALIHAMFKNPEWAERVVNITGEGKDVAVRNLGKQVWEEVDDVVEIAEKGWRPLELPKRLEAGLDEAYVKDLKNYIVAPEGRKVLEDALSFMYDPKKIEPALNAFSKFIGALRASTILPFGGYHVNNMFGNRWGRFLEGTAFDVISDADSVKVLSAAMKNDLDGLAEMSFKVGKDRYTGAQLLHIAEQNNVTTGGKFWQEVAKLGGAQEAADVGMLRKLNPLSSEQYGGKVARALEDHDRFAHWLGRLRKGDSIEAASASVDRVLFRYSDLSDAELSARNYLFFMTWYRKNLGLTMQKMWEYPGRMSLPLKLKHAFDGAFGEPESEYAVPQYLTDHIYFYLGKDPETGESMTFDPEKWLPPLSAGKFFQDLPIGPLRETISMLIPPLKMGIELATGKEIFSNREIREAPGQLKPFMGQEMAPETAYALGNWRVLKAISKTLWPGVEREGEYLGGGKAGKRTFGEVAGGFAKEFGGIKSIRTDAQRNRYFEGVSESTGIGADLDKIQSKLAGKVSPMQKTAYLHARDKLLWKKAEILRQMIDDGTDPFSGKPMDWEPPMPAPGTRKPHSMREIHTEMYSTLRSLYFGEPPTPGVLTVEPKTLLKPEESKQVFDTMSRLKIDMFGKDMDYALSAKTKQKDYLDNRVFEPIRDILRTPNYYERTGNVPSWDTHIYDYPMNFRQSLIPLWYQYLELAYGAGIIDDKGVRSRLKTFQELYEVDYQ